MMQTLHKQVIHYLYVSFVRVLFARSAVIWISLGDYWNNWSQTELWYCVYL